MPAAPPENLDDLPAESFAGLEALRERFIHDLQVDLFTTVKVVEKMVVARAALENRRAGVAARRAAAVA